MTYKTSIIRWLNLKNETMIVGKKSTILKSEKPNLTCPKCEKKDSITLNIIGDYGHLLLIPFISKGKRGESNCSNCKEVLPHQEMKSDLKLAYYELKEHVKTPIWFYGGLIAIKVLVIYKIIFINP